MLLIQVARDGTSVLLLSPQHPFGHTRVSLAREPRLRLARGRIGELSASVTRSWNRDAGTVVAAAVRARGAKCGPHFGPHFGRAVGLRAGASRKERRERPKRLASSRWCRGDVRARGGCEVWPTLRSGHTSCARGRAAGLGACGRAQLRAARAPHVLGVVAVASRRRARARGV
jgi:hypothetical protein